MEIVSLTKRYTSTPVNSRAGGIRQFQIFLGEHWVAGVLADSFPRKFPPCLWLLGTEGVVYRSYHDERCRD